MQNTRTELPGKLKRTKFAKHLPRSLPQGAVLTVADADGYIFRRPLTTPSSSLPTRPRNRAAIGGGIVGGEVCGR